MSSHKATDSMQELARVTSPKARPIDVLLQPLRSFSQHQLAGAGLLMVATAAAVVLANSRWADTYDHVLHTELGISFGAIALSKTVHHWINDGLMAVFFFLVGLEIKRELLVGELSTTRKATLPAIAAVGGMIVPAILYYWLNPTPPASAGWGVPMATDIAFALGVLALLGDRIPTGLRVFLTALAIVDDIGAVLVIAVFYTSDVSLLALGVGIACVLASIGLNALGTADPVPYFLVGSVAWLAFLQSGVHATIAALLMAFTIPARTRIDGRAFVERLRALLGSLEKTGVPTDTMMNDAKQQRLIEMMNDTIDMASAPLQRIEHALVGPVTFLVLPLFALANAGVHIGGSLSEALTHPITIGIVLGLFVGKTIGVTLASFLAVKLGLADLPANVGWVQLIGVGMLAGIGFTMALFVATLAFPEPAMVETAKVGILAASLISGVVGLIVVRFAPVAKPA